MERALILGRFQPPHLGHLDAIRRACQDFDEVVVVVGSAQAAGTPENPFSIKERRAMLEAALAEAALPNVRLVHLDDLDDHARWVAHVERNTPKFHAVVTMNPVTRRLFESAGYRVIHGVPFRRPECSGTNVRARLAAGKDVAALVPPSVSALLLRFGARARLKELLPHRGNRTD